jgi:hypothetical protein
MVLPLSNGSACAQRFAAKPSRKLVKQRIDGNPRIRFFMTVSFRWHDRLDWKNFAV